MGKFITSIEINNIIWNIFCETNEELAERDNHEMEYYYGQTSYPCKEIYLNETLSGLQYVLMQREKSMK